MAELRAQQTTVARAFAGDADAWHVVMREHQETVFRYSYLILQNSAEAEDNTQDTFLRAYMKREQFDQTRPLKPWLLQIATRLARNRQRSLSRYWAALQRGWRPAVVDGSAQDERIDAEAQAQRLWQAVQSLRPNAQEIIYLRFFLGLTPAETTATLDLPAGTVKSRSSRALQQLRAVIEREFPELAQTVPQE